MSEVMITTIDNPFNPFKQFAEWFAFDVAKGYHSCAYLGRIAQSVEELSERDEAIANEAAIDAIVSLNLSGKHKKVYEKDYEPNGSMYKRIHNLVDEQTG